MAPDCLTADCIKEEQWQIYQRVISGAKAANIPFAIGGGIAMGVYTGMWRDTKDIDLYVVPQDRHAIQSILAEAGLVDYFDQAPYDREWIYRSIHSKVIVDIIWSMANYKASVDMRWITGGPQVDIRGERVSVVPPEEMIWAKLYVLQRDRCDWPDVLNLIRSQAARLDWEHLLQRLGSDAPLLLGHLSVFCWLAPDVAETLPSWLMDRVSAVNCPGGDPDVTRSRAALLDRRPWFHQADPVSAS